MNKEIVNKISILLAAALLSACSAMAPQSAADTANRPILSAAEAKDQIRVTVRLVEPSPGESASDIPTIAALSD